MTDDSAILDALYRRAAQVLPDDPAAAVDLLAAAVRLAPAAGRAEMSVRHAGALWAAGRSADGELVLQSVLDDGAAPDQARRDAALALLRRQVGQVRLDAAARTVRALLGLPGAIDPGERELLLVLADSATERVDRERLRRLRVLAQQAPRQPSALPPSTLPFLASQVSAAYGAVDAAVEQMRQALTLADPVESPLLRVQLAYMLMADRPQQAADVLDPLRGSADQWMSTAIVIGEMFGAACRAEWDAAVHACESLATAPIHDGVVAGFHAFVAGMIARARGDAALADRVDRLAATAIDADDWLSRVNLDVAQADAALARGRTRPAADLVVACIGAVENSGAVGLTIKFANHVGVLLDAGRPRDAQRLRALIDEAADRQPGPLWALYVTWSDALLRDDPDRHLATEQATASSLRRDLAEIRERAGISLARAGRTTEATAVLRRAAEAYAQAQAWAAVSRVRGALRRLGVRLPASRDAGAALSRTESAVAEFASRGLTNSAIAARMGISTGTVGTHLSRAYRKLGVTSRVELAHRLREEQWVQP